MKLAMAREDISTRLWELIPGLHSILSAELSKKMLRDDVFRYLLNLETHIFNADHDVHALEKANARQCMEILKNFFSEVSEVFNIPGMGKNNLRAWQNHEVVTIKPDGSRVYMFIPWEKNIALTDVYLHDDVPIWDYLQELKNRGEDPDDYKTIWYYF